MQRGRRLKTRDAVATFASRESLLYGAARAPTSVLRTATSPAIAVEDLFLFDLAQDAIG
jgi:hypothetical protein